MDSVSCMTPPPPLAPAHLWLQQLEEHRQAASADKPVLHLRLTAHDAQQALEHCSERAVPGADQQAARQLVKAGAAADLLHCHCPCCAQVWHQWHHVHQCCP
jgi:hypothetical protein